MGDGSYTFAVMRNTGGSNYVETASTTADVHLVSEFAPFSQPNIFCDYNENSACVAKARELMMDYASSMYLTQMKAFNFKLGFNMLIGSNRSSRIL